MAEHYHPISHVSSIWHRSSSDRFHLRGDYSYRGGMGVSTAEGPRIQYGAGSRVQYGAGSRVGARDMLPYVVRGRLPYPVRGRLPYPVQGQAPVSEHGTCLRQAGEGLRRAGERGCWLLLGKGWEGRGRVGEVFGWEGWGGSQASGVEGLSRVRGGGEGVEGEGGSRLRGVEGEGVQGEGCPG